MEALMKHVRTSRHPWLIACDANMSPVDFKKNLWFRSRHMFIKAPGEDVSTCRSKSLNGELIERTYDCVIASRSFLGKIRNMEVVEDFESRPHKAVSSVVERERNPGMARTRHAQSATWFQWWKVARN